MKWNRPLPLDMFGFSFFGPSGYYTRWFSKVDIPSRDSISDGRVLLIDSKGHQSNVLNVVVVPDNYNWGHYFADTHTEAYANLDGQVTFVKSSYALQVDTKELEGINIWVLHCATTMWQRYQTCKWLSGSQPAPCCRFAFAKKEYRVERKGQWYPVVFLHEGEKLRSDIRPVFYYDPKTMDIFNDQKAVLSRFVFPPRTKNPPKPDLVEIDYENYLKKLEKHPLTRRCMKLIEVTCDAERQGPAE